MPLFEVPGWSMSTDPVKTTTKSRKRKRPIEHDDDDDDKLQAAQINLDKLMDTLKGGEGNEKPKKKKQKSKRNDIGNSLDPKNYERKEKKGGKDTEGALSSQKKLDDKKSRRKGESSIQTTAKLAKQADPPPDTEGLTKFQNRMKHSLDGARFRWINEMLYKSDSEHAVKMMREDPNAFQEYHVGFRHQVQAWPSNPVSHYVSELESYPAKTVIADLGCGDAALARTLVPKGMVVLSYDLVSDGTHVIEADTCSKIPLPGSEGAEGEISQGQGHIVDVAVCALSLMGSNWPKCVREAWRILKSGGEFKIAEVTSRFTNVEQFVSLISSIGFKFKTKDESNTHFILFEFKKVARKSKSEKDWEKIMAKGSLLKPCEYKRR